MKKREKKSQNVDVIITKHAIERARERFSFSAKALMKMARKAFYEGATLQELKERSCPILVICRQANNLRLYGEVLYLFSDNVLVTLYQIPASLRRAVKCS